jgi:hypothetical protein
LSRSPTLAPRGKSYRVYLVGGGSAVEFGWRDSTIDADLYSSRTEVFREIQSIKERLHVNVEFVRPEDFVPALEGSKSRHRFIDAISNVQFFHYDPYSQLLSKLVRGFRKDLEDAEHFLDEGMVDADRFRSLVDRIPATAYARYPALSREAVIEAVDEFLARRRRS